MPGFLERTKETMKLIEKISPSRAYIFGKCPLAESFRANGDHPLLPISPAARVGAIVHSVLEEAKRGSIIDNASFNACWEKESEKVEEEMTSSRVEKHLVPLVESARMYEVRKFQAWHLIETEFITNASTEKPLERSAAEVWMKSRSGKIVGRIDLLVSNDGMTEIIDYKTGKILDSSGNVKEEYKMQLKIYAGLYHENENEWPTKLVLVGLNSKRYLVDFTHEECEHILSDLTDRLTSVNQQIARRVTESALASPSPEVCRYCAFRPSCQSYWSKREDNADWPNDITGKVEQIQVSGMGFARVVLENKDRRYVVRGLSSRHALRTEQTCLAICNLTRDKESGEFTENLMTTIFQTD